MKRSPLKWLFTLVATIIISLVGISQTTTSSKSNFRFGNHAVFDSKRNEIYISSPNEFIEALDADSGKTKWKSNIKGKPLAVEKGILYVQHVGEKPNSELEIKGLGLDQKGKTMFSHTTVLPNNVYCYHKGEADGSFHLLPYPTNYGMLVEWIHRASYGGDYTPEESQKITRGFFNISEKSIQKISTKELPKDYKYISFVPSQKS